MTGFVRGWAAGLALLIVVSGGRLLAAEPLPAGPLPAGAPAALVVQKANEAIVHLGKPNYQAREAAAKTLLNLGETILPQLRKAYQETENPEVERRLEVLIETLNRQRLIEPRRITLVGKRVPVTELIKQLSVQSRYTLTVTESDALKNCKIDVNWNKTPFWEALDQVATAGGLSLSLTNESETPQLMLYENESYDPHVSICGPFRMTATNINSSRNINLQNIPRRFATSQQYESLNVNFQLMGEPKNAMISIFPTEITKATDELNNSLLGANDEYTRSYYTPYQYRSFNQYVGINLSRGDRRATMLKELNLKTKLLLHADSRPELTIDNLLTAKKPKAVSRSTEIQVESVSEAAGTLTISLIARQLRPDPNDYSWQNSVPQRIEIQDAAGVPYLLTNTSDNTNNGNGEIKLTMSFAPPAKPAKVGKPTKLVLIEWITLTQEVTFNFRDIPLP